MQGIDRVYTETVIVISKGCLTITAMVLIIHFPGLIHLNASLCLHFSFDVTFANIYFMLFSAKILRFYVTLDIKTYR